MKKIVLITLLLLGILLTACKPSNQNLDANGPAAQAPARTDPTAPVTEPTTAPTEPEPTEPIIDPAKQAELDKFTALFANLDSWYNRAVTNLYESPANMKLQWLFGIGFKDEAKEPTDAEWAALKDKPGFDSNYGFFRLPADKMNEVLTAYFGLTLADMSAESFDGLTYLESTDCYYFMTTGVIGEAMDFKATDVEAQEDGTIVISYTLSNGKAYEVGLKANDDGYRILFNRLAA